MSENKGDLISREAQNTSIALFMAENCYLNMSALDVLKMVADWVTEAPAVDAVQVVRCKDCKYWFAEAEERCKALNTEPFGWCCRTRSIDEAGHREITQNKDFCSYSAKMDGGDTND